MTKLSGGVRTAGARFSAWAAVGCTVLLGASAARAQVPLPTTTCDAAVSNTDMHFPSGMSREDGTKAFAYGDSGPFVTGGGSSITLTVTLRFAPSENTLIKLSALDDACAGRSSLGTVFTYSFSELNSQRNTITYDAAASEVGLNGQMQKALFVGTPRYLFVDVWDGEVPSQHASYSYVIDLQNPKNPTE